MSEGEEVKRRRRRSGQEIRRLMVEFRTSGLRASEFCRIHGLTHGTLQRGLRRERIARGWQGAAKRLVAVEVTNGDGLDARIPQEALTLRSRKFRQSRVHQKHIRRLPLSCDRWSEPGVRLHFRPVGTRFASGCTPVRAPVGAAPARQQTSSDHGRDDACAKTGESAG